ncbi:hypothetical protein ACM64Y_08965 [Novispirillum sp. DQ9]|uniref:hypothetical protein n=1 Tax=Novispirillum sp. DQ9 TaxID=3398612 RepID=UPI003C7E2250
MSFLGLGGTTDVAGLTWVPLVPWPLLIALGAVALLLVLFGLVRGARGALLRGIPLGALLLILAGPELVREARTPLPDVAVVVVDDSPSQGLGERRARTDAAAQALRERLEADKTVEVRVVRAGSAPGRDGTHLIGALNDAVADVPRQRLAGAVLLTDGQVHDVPADGGAFAAPVHVLLSGRRGEADRRVVVEAAPSFGLVGRQATLRVTVQDPAVEPGARVPLRITIGDGAPRELPAEVGQPVEIPVPIRDAGANVVEVAAAPRDDELTTLNNRVALSINGVRDRLRVLLISGEPHVGERAWRNLLKSDPNVDLVHFTILRPPTKDDGTPLTELALIAFPIRELFEDRLAEFDLIVFDRYSRRGLVPFGFLRNIADYVRGGGAVLQAVGPEYAGPYSLYDSPLAEVLPAAPMGQVASSRYTPGLSAKGRSHPVTAGLDGAGDEDEPPTWGDWLRLVPAAVNRGDVLMTGADAQPLLVLDRVEEGRVALLLSDTLWLWQRGWDGGGPQTELIRRMAHWLMKEPELEEEALRARVADGTLEIERRTLEITDPAPPQVTVTPPEGEDRTLPLQASAPGRQTAALRAEVPGLYRVSDGERVAVAAAGAANPLEMGEVATTADRLGPLADATGGGVFWLGESDGLPEVRRTAPSALQAGDGWLGLRANQDYVVNGVRQTALLPPALALPLVLAGLMLAWWREGK